MNFAQPTSATNPEVPVFVPEYKQTPAHLDEIYHQFLRVLALNQEWKKIVPLMAWFNNTHIHESGSLTAEEVQEAVDELRFGTLEKFLAEWADSLNLPSGLAASQHFDIHFQTAVVGLVNGQGKSSSVFERAEEIGRNFSTQPEKLEKDITQFYILMLSALIHAPQFSANLVELSLKKMQDNLQNYPAELFGVTDVVGKPLPPELLQAKYLHVVRCLKWLRSLAPGRMLPEDWRAVKSEILAFQSSDESFRMLQTRWFELHPELQTILVPAQQNGDSFYDFARVPDYV